MKRVLALLLALTLPPAFQEAQPQGAPSPASQNSTAPATTSGRCGPNYYRNVDGVCVHRPVKMQGAAPKGATAQCRDGSYSFSQHRRGTCNHHGGVARWL